MNLPGRDGPSVVVTGATGFLGRHAVRMLEQAGYRTIAVTRGTAAGMQHVEDYAESPSGDALLHLAESSDRALANSTEEQALSAATATVRHLASRFGSRMVYASSAAVYGDQTPLPRSEDSPVIPSDPYNRLKLRNEEVVLKAGGTVSRFSNIYGRGMARSNVLSDILQQIPGDGPLFVRDDQPVRDYLAVTDAALACVCMIHAGYHGVLNVGSGVGTSVRQLAGLALMAGGESHRPVIARGTASVPSINVLDVKRAALSIGWSAASDLATQIKSDFFSSEVSENG